jgi:hypothetical protein
MINSISLNAYSYNTQFATPSGGGKLFVPVNPSMVIYSQFDHVAGVAARQGQNGVSVSKIKILNTLIEQLVSMRNNRSIKEAPAPESDEDIDALIKNYQSEIQALTKQPQGNPYSLSPESGMLFSISA